MERGIILNRLLDKYEASAHLLHPGSSKRRVLLRIERGELPEYDYERADTRDAYNAAAKALERDGVIAVEWAADRPLLMRIALNLDAAQRAYAIAGRRHPAERARAVAAAIRDALVGVRTPWMLEWGRETCAQAEARCRVPAFCRDDPAALDGLLRALRCRDTLGEEPISLRAFSIQCFRDSKRFEREYQDEFLRIARKYNAELAEAITGEELSPRDQLAFLGIYARPELYELAGCISIVTDAGETDLSPLYPQGIALPGAQVERIRKFGMDAVRRIVFIENRTNYDEYLQTEISPGDLAVYQGGFLSPNKRRLFQKLAACAASETEAYLWADIDLGGFRMFDQLRRIFPRLNPMRMSPEDVERFRDRGLVRPEPYLQKLKEEAERYPLFSEAIEKILQYGVTIEQEVFYA